MTEHKIISYRQKDEIDDPLTEILRAGARRLITQAVEAEFDTFLSANAELVLPDGRQRVVRHGHDPVRTIQTGIGPIEVEKPKARDRGAAEGGAEFGSRRISCRNGHGAPRVWTLCCRFSICAAFRPAIFRKSSLPCWARTRPTFRQP